MPFQVAIPVLHEAQILSTLHTPDNRPLAAAFGSTCPASLGDVVREVVDPIKAHGLGGLGACQGGPVWGHLDGRAIQQELGPRRGVGQTGILFIILLFYFVLLFIILFHFFIFYDYLLFYLFIYIY